MNMAHRRIDAAMNPQGQAIAKAVDAVEQFLQMVLAKAQHMQDGPEDLAFQAVEAIDLEGPRGNEPTLGTTGTEAGFVNQLTLARHARRMGLQHRLGIAIDHRPHICRKQSGIADLEFGHGAAQHVEKLVGDIFLDAENAQGRAALARALKGGDQHIAHHLLGQGR